MWSKNGEYYKVIASIKNQIRSSDTNIEKTSRLVEEGAIAEENLQNLQMQQQNEYFSLSDSHGVLKSAIIDLCSLLYIDQYDDFDVSDIINDNPESIMLNSLSDIIASAETLPQINSARQKIKSAEYAVKIAKGELYPTISFNSSYLSSYSDARKKISLDQNGNPIINNGIPIYKEYPFVNQLHDNRTSVIGLSISIPIFSSLYRRNNIKLSKINLQQQHYILQNTKNALKKEITKTYSDVNTAKEKYEYSLETVRHAKEVVAHTESKLDNGIITIADYVIAKNNILMAEAQACKAKYEYLLKLKLLKFYYTQEIH